MRHLLFAAFVVLTLGLTALAASAQDTPPDGESPSAPDGAESPEGDAAPLEAPPSDVPAGDAAVTEALPTELADDTSSAVALPSGLPVPPPLDPPLLPAEEIEPLDEEEQSVLIALEAGEGLLVSTPDHNFELNIRSRGMLLLSIEIPEELEADGSHADPIIDLDVRRARVVIGGRIFDRHIRYRLQLAVAPRDMQETTFADASRGGFPSLTGAPTRSPLLDWYVELQHLRDLHVRVGQFIVPYNRHRVISSSSLQMVDRSLASAELNLDRDLGIQLYSPDVGGMGWLRYYAGLFTNEGRDGLFGGDPGFLYTLRAEVLPLGLFDDYAEGDTRRNDTPRLSIGVGYAFADDSHLAQITIGQASPDASLFDYHNAEVDLVFMYEGLSISSELMWREGWRQPPAPAMTDPCALDAATMALPRSCRPRNGVGWYAGIGYVLPVVDLEIAARYGWIRPIGGSVSGTGERSELGVGLNYYFHRHAFKIQIDYFRLWDDADFSDGSAIGVGEDRIRMMFQASL